MLLKLIEVLEKVGNELVDACGRVMAAQIDQALERSKELIIGEGWLLWLKAVLLSVPANFSRLAVKFPNGLELELGLQVLGELLHEAQLFVLVLLHLEQVGD